MTTAVLRQHAEHQFAEELEELKKVDNRQRPVNWQLSPWAVVAYLVFHVLSDVFGADAGNRDDWTQEGSDGGGPAARHVGRATTSVHRP